MEIINLGEQNSLLNHFISELRDEQIQTDSLRFRENLKRIGSLMAYEISKTFSYKEKDVVTPLGTAKCSLSEDKIVLATILRAGLPMHEGMHYFFDRVENAFISANRKYETGNSFHIEFGYISTPRLDEKILIIADPMLASGASIELACKALMRKGTPNHIHIATIISSRKGVEFLTNKLGNENVTLWVGAVDDKLNSKSYIVPGLGDAGDLAYGIKID